MSLIVDAAKEAVGHDPEAMGKIVEPFVRLTGHVLGSHQSIKAGRLGTQIGERPDA